MEHDESEQQLVTRLLSDDDEGWQPPRRPNRSLQERLDHQQAVLAAFKTLEDARWLMQNAANELHQLISRDPCQEWPALWQAFLEAGGVSSAELCRFLLHRRAIRSTSQHRHLRLIGDSKNKPLLDAAHGSDHAA